MSLRNVLNALVSLVCPPPPDCNSESHSGGGRPSKSAAARRQASRRRNFFRPLRTEQLEDRRVLTADFTPSMYYNSMLPSDVNHDGIISPLDANSIATFMGGNPNVSIPTPPFTTSPQQYSYDVNHDNMINILDFSATTTALNNLFSSMNGTGGSLGSGNYGTSSYVSTPAMIAITTPSTVTTNTVAVAPTYESSKLDNLILPNRKTDLPPLAMPSGPNNPAESIWVSSGYDVWEGGGEDSFAKLEFSGGVNFSTGAPLDVVFVYEVSTGKMIDFAKLTGGGHFTWSVGFQDDNPTGTLQDPASFMFVAQSKHQFGYVKQALFTTYGLVHNRAPQIHNPQIKNYLDPSEPNLIGRGGTVELTFQVQDEGLRDTHQVEINWGDGTPTESFDAKRPETVGYTIQRVHTYAPRSSSGPENLTYTPVISVTDDDGGNATVSSVGINSKLRTPKVRIAATENANLHEIANQVFEHPEQKDQQGFKVYLSDGPVDYPITVKFRVDGDPGSNSVYKRDAYAIRNLDYVLRNAGADSVVIPAGSDFVIIEVVVKPDLIVESAEKVDIELETPIAIASSYPTYEIAKPGASVSIADNDEWYWATTVPNKNEINYDSGVIDPTYGDSASYTTGVNSKGQSIATILISENGVDSKMDSWFEYTDHTSFGTYTTRKKIILNEANLNYEFNPETGVIARRSNTDSKNSPPEGPKSAAALDAAIGFDETFNNSLDPQDPLTKSVKLEMAFVSGAGGNIGSEEGVSLGGSGKSGKKGGEFGADAVFKTSANGGETFLRKKPSFTFTVKTRDKSE